MKREGKIKYTGVSLHEVKHGFDAIRAGFDILQVKINPDHDEALDLCGLVNTANCEGVRIVVKEPLARGKYACDAKKVFRWLAETGVTQVLVGTNNFTHLQEAKSILDKPSVMSAQQRRVNDRRDSIVKIFGSLQAFRKSLKAGT